jgi:hypothetical protein
VKGQSAIWNEVNGMDKQDKKKRIAAYKSKPVVGGV